jgi:hypothetical protein
MIDGPKWILYAGGMDTPICLMDTPSKLLWIFIISFTIGIVRSIILGLHKK